MNAFLSQPVGTLIAICLLYVAGVESLIPGEWMDGWVKVFAYLIPFALIVRAILNP